MANTASVTLSGGSLGGTVVVVDLDATPVGSEIQIDHVDSDTRHTYRIDLLPAQYQGVLTALESPIPA